MMIQGCVLASKHKHLMSRSIKSRSCVSVCVLMCCVRCVLSHSPHLDVYYYLNASPFWSLCWSCCSWTDNLNDLFSHYSHHACLRCVSHIFQGMCLLILFENFEYMDISHICISYFHLYRFFTRLCVLLCLIKKIMCRGIHGSRPKKRKRDGKGKYIQWKVT